MKKYDRQFKERINISRHGITEDINKIIVLLKECSSILHKRSLSESLVSDRRVELKLEEVIDLKKSVREKLNHLDEVERDVSIELFVFCRIKMVGSSTVIEKNFPTSSFYAGKNIYSLMNEIRNCNMTEGERMVYMDVLASFILLMGMYNKVTKAYSKTFIIKTLEDLIISDTIIKKVHHSLKI